MIQTATQVVKAIAEVDAWCWAISERIKLQAGTFRKAGHEYQIEPMQSKEKHKVIKKGAQLGFTELVILLVLHGAIRNRFPLGSLYLFPISKDVSDFSQARFTPLIENNPEAIGRFIKSTDRVELKQIGTGMLYFRGARVTGKAGGVKEESTRLKTIPVDIVVRDERDSMNDKMAAMSTERVAHSDIKEEIDLSTPSIPDWGIDKLYNESDARHWLIKCKKCGAWTCLETSFPDCILMRNDGTYFRACRKCHEEIYPRDGRYVPKYPDRKGHAPAGWWVSQLNSLYVDPGDILKAFRVPPVGGVQEVYNSKLGMAYIESQNRLTLSSVYNCCTRDIMSLSSTGPSAMGVDVGKKLHVVIGEKENEQQYRVTKIAVCDSWNEVGALGKQFNVSTAVIDMLPEMHKAREFGEEQKYEVFLCQYSEHLNHDWEFNFKNNIVTANRTTICDYTHSLVTIISRLMLPMVSEMIKEFAAQLCNIAKVVEVNEFSGAEIPRYKKVGEDHFRHALNYFYLAAQRVGLAEKQHHRRGVKKQTTADMNYAVTEMN